MMGSEHTQQRGANFLWGNNRDKLRTILLHLHAPPEADKSTLCLSCVMTKGISSSEELRLHPLNTTPGTNFFSQVNAPFCVISQKIVGMFVYTEKLLENDGSIFASATPLPEAEKAPGWREQTVHEGICLLKCVGLSL